MPTAIEELLQAPDLPTQVARLGELLAAERVRRERFYEEMTEEGKWEFINGEAIMHSPAKSRHSAASDFLYLLLAAYVNQRGLGRVAHEKLLVCLERNDYEPDLCYFTKEKAAAFTPDQMKFPVPDFIAEVLSPSTEAIDRGVKFIDYARSGVGEYWIIDPEEETVEKYMVSERRYTLEVKLREGEIASTVIEGLRLPVRAIFDRELNLTALRAVLG